MIRDTVYDPYVTIFFLCEFDTRTLWMWNHPFCFDFIYLLIYIFTCLFSCLFLLNFLVDILNSLQNIQIWSLNLVRRIRVLNSTLDRKLIFSPSISCKVSRGSYTLTDLIRQVNIQVPWRSPCYNDIFTQSLSSKPLFQSHHKFRHTMFLG